MEKLINNKYGLKEEDIDKITYKVRAIILDDNNIILENYSNILMLPGGKINNNENDIDALFREIKEELGIELDLNEIEPFIEYDNYIKNYLSRDNETINKLNKTKYYIIKTNKKINLNKTKLSDNEKKNKFKIIKINLDDMYIFINNFKSNNPRFKYFKNELTEIISELKNYLLNKNVNLAIKNRNKTEIQETTYISKNGTLKKTDLNKLIDMHTHTFFSDGELSPDELIKLAIEKNIGTIAITDHDTVNGIKQIDKLKYENIKIINGIELSSKSKTGQMHILGYGININNDYLNKKLIEIKNNSIYHIISLLHQIRKDYNIIFTTEDIQNLINANHNLNRVDLAKLCVKYKIANNVQDAFNKYLIDANEKIRSDKRGLSYNECIDLITKSGGIPVLAHPKSLELNDVDFLKLLKKMIESGLQGIECYHSSFTKEESIKYLDIAKKYNLLISGGSDYHGKNVKPNIELGTGKTNNLKIKSLTLLDKLKR